MTAVTYHAEHRAASRLKDDAKQLATLAAQFGVPWERTTGDLRRYLLLRRHRNAHRGSRDVIYRDGVFVFSDQGVLITCWRLPPRYRGKA